ncbi:hypothetical protein P700755_000100 [Psychroflexus torquis ATCC 700755]|uniref:DUF4468 domain-containing protein n=1 Tax=Psychroflexus torquis (strain ATCC 700755 / CIP 106069 / ACAM 623) TaxID=313595 RepID=K4INP4_PSYTT|nr:DUF4468 domain-containing protein [Psychroflexus torquis]AFU67170.1 hypothetical protein P700755_000100 [Psychroflexus torquis ATCC 700755]
MTFKYVLAFCFISLLSNLSLSQTTELPSFNFENYEFPKVVVVDVKEKKAKVIRDKTQSWIDSYFTKEQLIGSENSEGTLVVKAVSKNLLSIKNLSNDLIYTLKISFRDQKYRLEISQISYNYYTEIRRITPLNLKTDDAIKKDLVKSQPILTSFFNDLNLNLYNSILKDNDEW